MDLTSWENKWCITSADNLQLVDNMCMMWSTVGDNQSLRMTLWSLCGNVLWKIVASQLWNWVVISHRFPALFRTELSCSTYCSEILYRWVPKQLVPEHKAKCMVSALTFLQWYHDDGSEFLDQIITGNDTYKPSSSQCIGITVDLPKRLNSSRLCWRSKVCMVFWDRQSILLVDFLNRDESVNAELYCKMLQKLQQAI